MGVRKRTKPACEPLFSPQLLRKYPLYIISKNRSRVLIDRLTSQANCPFLSEANLNYKMKANNIITFIKGFDGDV